MEVWPASLQDYLNEESFSFAPGSVVIESQNETGPPKIRRRITKSVDRISCTITIDKDDFQTFYDFFYTTLAGGVNYFGFDHPLTGNPTSFKIKPGWSVNPKGGRTFVVSMEWEETLS